MSSCTFTYCGHSSWLCTLDGPCRFLGLERVVPIHYATLPELTGTPDILRQELAKRAVDCEMVVLEPGERWSP